jgi:hypothetical protein
VLLPVHGGAYKLEQLRREREEQSQRIGAANKAIYTLANMWSILRQYQKEVIAPYRDKQDAWLNLSAQPLFQYGLTHFDTSELSFLLNSPEPNIFADLMLEDHRFHLLIGLIEQRSKVQFEQAWPAISAAGIGLNQPLSQDDIEEILGISIVRQLQVLTEAIVRQVDENISSLREVHDEFRNTMQRLNPRQRFSRFEQTVD